MFTNPRRISTHKCSIWTSKGRIAFVLKCSPRRRTMAIGVGEEALVSVAAPVFVSEKDIHSFIRQKADWITEKVAQVKRRQDVLGKQKFEHGYKFLFLGKKYPINVGDQKSGVRTHVTFDESMWNIRLPSGLTVEQASVEIRRKLLQWYRTQAKEILGGRIFHYARIIGVEPKAIAVRTQKRLWGVCDYRAQSISLNWQIVLSPMMVVDYVVVHELCHLIEPNHSKRFWKKVGEVIPDFEKRRKWLSDNALDMILPE